VPDACSSTHGKSPPVVQFFYRKLKPEARPIAQPKDMDVVVSAADCRLSAFATVDDATRCWIKVRAALADQRWLATANLCPPAARCAKE
jgi:Phosphatidylserine decarboxylase